MVIAAVVVGSSAAAHAFVADPDSTRCKTNFILIPQPLKLTAGGLLELMAVAMVALPLPSRMS